MPGGGRRWKTLVSRYGSSKLDIGFPTAAPLPWKSPKARFPHFHSAGDGLTHINQEDKTKTHALRPSRLKDSPKEISVASRHPLFRIILNWNQKAVSVSFFDWKMLFHFRRQHPGPRRRWISSEATVAPAYVAQRTLCGTRARRRLRGSRGWR
jgi:hypothetical protein